MPCFGSNLITAAKHRPFPRVLEQLASGKALGSRAEGQGVPAATVVTGSRKALCLPSPEAGIFRHHGLCQTFPDRVGPRAAPPSVPRAPFWKGRDRGVPRRRDAEERLAPPQVSVRSAAKGRVGKMLRTRGILEGLWKSGENGSWQGLRIAEKKRRHSGRLPCWFGRMMRSGREGGNDGKSLGGQEGRRKSFSRAPGVGLTEMRDDDAGAVVVRDFAGCWALARP